ncbi:TIGR01777 family oxidoreductase [Sulfurimonas sp. HSL-1716]|uniref:TIGR01777 family oxidoreductase n=1 Tax=Hydrocurvibacter sulfurireducens TaxID=3131937 RepID=UPI0031F997D4
MKIAITGASGFVGTAIQQQYKDVVYVHRNDSKELILEKLEGVDVVINLAGAPIIKRWNKEYKKILISSRVDTTKTLVAAINESEVKHLISTSAVGIYPDNVPCDETTKEIADDFLGSLASRWENVALSCSKPTAILRFGIVLGKEGGALKQMLTPFRLGVGGIIGDGKAMMSWISIVDLVHIYKFVIENNLTGIYNATTPNPVTNRVFTKALGKALHRPTIFPLPEFVLKIIYGEAAGVVTGSKEVYPKALQDAGYQFIHPDIDRALKELLQ